MFKFFIFIVLLFKLVYAQHNTNVCNEELYIKQLATGQVNTYFQFTTHWQYDSIDNLFHTNFVPISLAELINLYKFKELHVSLTHGVWKYDQWGYPPVEAAPGAEVWAWFQNDTKSNIDLKWTNLCSSLSGLLCASLSFIDETNTISPKFTFRPTYNNVNSNKTGSDQIRYGTLPNEIVCTENLTPWKKLLPCAGNEGFGFLLNSDNIYSTNYHSIGIHIRELCQFSNGECTKKILEVKQTVNLIFDHLIIENRDWGFRTLFGHGLNGPCTLADTSKIYVDMTNNNFVLNPSPTRVFTSTRGGNEQLIAEYDMKKNPRNKMFGIGVQNEKPSPIPVSLASPLDAKRYLLGVGQERGQIVTKIMNNHWAPIFIVLQENVPWFVPMYLHTLKLRIDGKEVEPIWVEYNPGELRKRPYHLEVAFKIPARKRLDFSIDFDYIFLKWLEYPPDANHGHYIGSAVLTAQLSTAKNYTSVPIDGSLFYHGFNASRDGYLVQIRTESLLITLPTPDFSMPYNVICLACTVVALAFGPIHNIATKKLVITKQNKQETLIKKLKRKIFNVQETETSTE